MLRPLRKIVIFSYADKPPETLYRHERILRLAARICTWCGVASFALLLDFAVSGDWYGRWVPGLDRWFALVVIVLFATFVLFFGPMILAFPLVAEIRRELVLRSLPAPPGKLEDEVTSAAIKAGLYFIGLMVLLLMAHRR